MSTQQYSFTTLVSGQLNAGDYVMVTTSVAGPAAIIPRGGGCASAVRDAVVQSIVDAAACRVQTTHSACAGQTDVYPSASP